MSDPFAALFASLAERYPDTFGGMHFEDRAAIVVQVLDTPDAGTMVRDATEYVEAYYPIDATPSIRAVTVRNSYATLTDVAGRVEADRATIANQGGELARVIVDLQRNRVIAAFIDTPPDVQVRIVSSYAEPDVLVPATTNRGHRRKLGRKTAETDA